MHGIYIIFEKTENIQLVIEEIKHASKEKGFSPISNCFYITEKDSLVYLHIFMSWLQKKNLYGKFIKQILAFKIEDFSDFTPLMKEDNI